ncbi:hypothetical protein IWX49DRAFT_203946 [Phyllosticta citricarpa]|uniref:C2H2-type domain-containing protein n=1 Tax=Phyllosticta citricarpa TaxID=55181 RepID=A0ABR1LZV4_9PEZI
MRCGSCLCLACIAFVACSRTHRRCIICSTRPPRAPKPSESASLCQKKLESSTRPPGKSPCSCTCMTTPVAWPGTSPDGPTVPRYMPSYLPRLTPDPLYNTTLMGFFFCVQISPELFQSDQPRGFDLQPRLPLGSRHLPIAAENIFCRWLHCNVACGHCFCSFSHAGKASHPRNGPDHDKPPVLAPPTHQQGQKPRGHQNMFNLQLCCDISIVVAAAAAAAAVVCRHRATPLLDQAFSQTRPLTPKPSTATCNAPVPTYLVRKRSGGPTVCHHRLKQQSLLVSGKTQNRFPGAGCSRLFSSHLSNCHDNPPSLVLWSVGLQILPSTRSAGRPNGHVSVPDFCFVPPCSKVSESTAS